MFLALCRHVKGGSSAWPTSFFNNGANAGKRPKIAAGMLALFPVLGFTLAQSLAAMSGDFSSEERKSKKLVWCFNSKYSLTQSTSVTQAVKCGVSNHQILVANQESLAKQVEEERARRELIKAADKARRELVAKRAAKAEQRKRDAEEAPLLAARAVQSAIDSLALLQSAAESPEATLIGSGDGASSEDGDEDGDEEGESQETVSQTRALRLAVETASTNPFAPRAKRVRYISSALEFP